MREEGRGVGRAQRGERGARFAATARPNMREQRAQHVGAHAVVGRLVEEGAVEGGGGGGAGGRGGRERGGRGDRVAPPDRRRQRVPTARHRAGEPGQAAARGGQRAAQGGVGSLARGRGPSAAQRERAPRVERAKRGTPAVAAAGAELGQPGVGGGRRLEQGAHDGGRGTRARGVGRAAFAAVAGLGARPPSTTDRRQPRVGRACKFEAAAHGAHRGARVVAARGRPQDKRERGRQRVPRRARQPPARQGRERRRGLGRQVERGRAVEHGEEEVGVGACGGRKARRDRVGRRVGDDLGQERQHVRPHCGRHAVEGVEQGVGERGRVGDCVEPAQLGQQLALRRLAARAAAERGQGGEQGAGHVGLERQRGEQRAHERVAGGRASLAHHHGHQRLVQRVGVAAKEGGLEAADKRGAPRRVARGGLQGCPERARVGHVKATRRSGAPGGDAGVGELREGGGSGASCEFGARRGGRATRHHARRLAHDQLAPPATVRGEEKPRARPPKRNSPRCQTRRPAPLGAACRGPGGATAAGCGRAREGRERRTWRGKSGGGRRSADSAAPMLSADTRQHLS